VSILLRLGNQPRAGDDIIRDPDRQGQPVWIRPYWPCPSQLDATSPLHSSCFFPTESMISAMSRDEEPKGKPVALDPNAISASPTEPAFVAPPKGAPVYHGFVVLEDVSVEGFTFGAITDFEAESCDAGDAFVVAPDGSRAGLVWEVSPQSTSRKCDLSSETGGAFGQSRSRTLWSTAQMLARIWLLCYPS
jgi:hypothetical protein